MTKTTIAALIAAGLIAAGCGDDANPDTAPPDRAAPSMIPAPNAAEADELLDRLAGVERGLAIEDSIDNARNTCTSILGGVAPAKLVEATKTRFTGDGISDMTTSQARAVIRIVRESAWCKPTEG